jgi:hypothetical protein
MRSLRRLVPLAVSATLIAWLLTRFSFGKLVNAAAVLPWQALLPMTAALVVALYLWDVVCLLTVFSEDGRRLTYGQMLRIRGRSYVVSVVNQALGQGAVAWEVSRAQQTSLLAALSRTVLLAWHEGLILGTAALLGSFWSQTVPAARCRWIAVGLLALVVGGAVVLALVPARLRARLARTRLGAWLGSWTWRRSVRLLAQRTVYFGFVAMYVTAALPVCGLGVPFAAALAAIPLVLVSTMLPSLSGLGPRETALILLLPSQHPDGLLAMGLIWSTGIIVVRLLIGLAWLWLGPNEPHRYSFASSSGSGRALVGEQDDGAGYRVSGPGSDPSSGTAPSAASRSA